MVGWLVVGLLVVGCWLVGWLLVVLLVVLLVGWFVGKAKIGFAKNITKCCYGVRDKKDLRF